jgi:hypothetical protein
MSTHTVMLRFVSLFGFFLWAGVILPRAEIVINEIMYHPAPGQAGEEFIELHNTGPSAVELTGWRLDDAVRYRFEATTLFPGDYLVVTADVDAFRAAYPGVSPVVGNWEGRLSNRGETVVLRDGLDRVVDEVSYADEGDWAVRVEGPLDFGHRGWAWESLCDGGGHSLELLHPAAPNAHGQSWGMSVLPGGTPGRVNSAVVEGIAPLIGSVQHAPRIPRSTDPVVVSARVMTESGGASTAVTLHYRRDELLPGPFAVEAMFDDGQHGDGWAGDQVYGVRLPPQEDQSVVEFYVRATDAAGRERTWPAPVRTSDGQWAQRANLLYQVSDAATGLEPPVYRLILTAAERAELVVIGSDSPDRQSNAQFNATWISDTGIAQEVRYLVGVRHRGHGSRGLQPNNFRINFRSDDLWQGVEALNLNGQYSYLQHFGSVLCRMAGLPAATSYSAKLIVNDVDPSELGPSHLTYGRYAVNEVLNGDFVERLFPGDDDGELYLGQAADLTNQEADFRYLGPDPEPYRAVYFKQTQRDADDWRELIALCRMFEESSDDRLAENVAATIQLEDWLTYFAVMTLLDNRETGLHTGFGDDFALYAGTEDHRFQLIPHDLDTILGQGNVTGATNAPLFAATRIPALNRLLKAPEIAPRYYAALGRLRETLFAPQHFNVLADQALRSYVPLGVIDNLKRFAAGRAAYVQAMVPDRLVARLGLVEQGGIHYTDQKTLDLEGEANAIETYGIRINGQSANWSAWEATWTAAGIPLVPGLNRVIIEALGSGGAAF